MHIEWWAAAFGSIAFAGCGLVAPDPNAAALATPTGAVVEPDASPLDVGAEIAAVSTSSAPYTPPSNRPVACKPPPSKCDPTVPRGVRSMALPPPGIALAGWNDPGWDGEKVLYVFPFRDTSGIDYAAHAATYDPATDEWTVIDDPPRDAMGPISGANGMFFVAGEGTPGSTVLHEWRPGLGWRLVANHPAMWVSPTRMFWSVATNEVLAFIGVRTGGEQIFAWNDAAATWTPRAALPSDDSKHVWMDGGVWVGTKLVFGDAWYDVVADAWTYGPPMPLFGGLAVSLPDCDSAAVLGGRHDSPLDRSLSWVYWSPAMNAWEEAPEVPLDENAGGRFGTGDRFFVWDSWHMGAKRAVGDPTGWVFSLSTATWEKLPDGRPSNGANPVWTGCDAVFFEPGSPIAFRYRP